MLARANSHSSKVVENHYIILNIERIVDLASKAKKEFTGSPMKLPDTALSAKETRPPLPTAGKLNDSGFESSMNATRNLFDSGLALTSTPTPRERPNANRNTSSSARKEREMDIDSPPRRGMPAKKRLRLQKPKAFKTNTRVFWERREVELVRDWGVRNRGKRWSALRDEIQTGKNDWDEIFPPNHISTTHLRDCWNRIITGTYTESLGIPRPPSPDPT